MSKKIGSYSFNFTQPHLTYDYMKFLVSDAVSLELEILEEIDRLVEEGLTNPSADAIINRVTR